MRKATRVVGGLHASHALPPCASRWNGCSLFKRGVALAMPFLLLLTFFLSPEGLLLAGCMKYGSRGSSVSSFSWARKHALSAETRLSLSDQSSNYHPSLSLEEGDDCILVEGVPANIPAEKKTMKLTVESWVNHRDAQVEVSGALRAEQTLPSITPNRGQQFYLTFTLPKNIFFLGPATLSLFNTSQNTDCRTHELQILRMPDDSFRSTRDDSKAISDAVVTLQVGTYMTYSEVDVSSLFYGKVAKGGKLHLLFREKNSGCWSVFQDPKEGNAPSLSISIVDSSPMNATYEAWGEYSKCRVSCTSTMNFQCRKRACLPGIGGGTPCLADQMLQRQPCQNPTSATKCTCQNLESEKACPINATCTESSTDGARCTCTVGFTRKDFTEKTTCQRQATPTNTLSPGGNNVVFGSTATTTSRTTTATNESTTDWTKWYWIGGVSAGVILLALIAVMSMKRPSPPAHIEAVPGMQPGAPGYWPDGGGQAGPQGGVPAFAMAPMPPGTRMQGPAAPPGAPRMF